jgi:outer membrane lipoprotein-sorting protein
MRKLNARARWAVPIAAVATVGVVIAVSAVASASEPDLPARTAAQLLTEVQQAVVRPLQPLTATVQETANLGLPALPQIGQSVPASSPDPLAGTTTLDLWYLNPQHVRLAEPTQLGESDLRLDGTKLWLWDSKSQTATHVLLPARSASDFYGGGAFAGTQHSQSSAAESGSFSATLTPTPAAITRQLLAAIGPSTSVRVQQNVTVAGRAAYQLAFAPKAAGSLVGQIVVAIDASTHLPLRVQVFAAGSSSPAFQLGFTALSFGAPAASNFTFTPPPGAKVKTVKVPDGLPKGELGALGGLGGLSGLGTSGLVPGFSGSGITLTPASGKAKRIIRRPVLELPAPSGPGSAAKPSQAELKAIEQGFAASLPKSMSKAQRAAAVKAFTSGMTKQWGKLGLAGAPPLGGRLPAGNNGGGFYTANPLGGSPQVLGKDWLSVVATQPSPAIVALLAQAGAGKGYSAFSSSINGTSSQGSGSATAASSVVYSSETITTNPPGPAGPDLAVLRALLHATTSVSGSWGHGRLLRTSLLSVLITSNGRVLFGAVTPAVLYADAASLSR